MSDKQLWYQNYKKNEILTKNWNKLVNIYIEQGKHRTKKNEKEGNEKEGNEKEGREQE